MRRLHPSFLLKQIKSIGAGAATIALAGAAIGNVFSSLIHAVARTFAKQLFGILGDGTEAIALFALMMAFLILFVFDYAEIARLQENIDRLTQEIDEKKNSLRSRAGRAGTPKRAEMTRKGKRKRRK